MTSDEVRPIVALLAGYWPTPAITAEEALAYAVELTAVPMRIKSEEATTVVARAARSGETFRIRPGQITEAVQALRRRRGLYRPALAPVPVVHDGPEYARHFTEFRAVCVAAGQHKARMRDARRGSDVVEVRGVA